MIQLLDFLGMRKRATDSREVVNRFVDTWLRGQFEIGTVLKSGRVVNRQKFKNAVTTLGANYILDTGLGGGAATTTWYVGSISTAGFSTPLVSDTLASKPWTEFTDYATTRPVWTSVAASSGLKTNAASPASITTNAAGSISGLFLAAVNTRGGTLGLLYSTGVLGAARAVANGETLQLIYNANLTPSS